MAICEDAPCCGCCGPAVWAADALAEEERAWDRMLEGEQLARYFEDDEDGELWDEDDAWDGNEDAGMEAGLVGWDC